MYTKRYLRLRRVGADFPLLINYVSFILFTAANGVVMRDAIKSFMDVGDNTAIIFFDLMSFTIGLLSASIGLQLAMLLPVLAFVLLMSSHLRKSCQQRRSLQLA